jgi:hypothetical protein
MHREEIELDTEVEDEVEEDLEEARHSSPQLPKSRHYARECPLPPATCMYCRARDHDTEECPTLLGKIQEKWNQKNQNVQWISAEARDDGRNINIVTHGGYKIGADVVRHDPTQHQWVKKNTEPQDSLMRGKKNKYSRKKGRISSSKMLHLHQLCNILRMYQCTRFPYQWITPVKYHL